MAEPEPSASAQLLTALTTEHFTLQGARSQTMSESSSRAAVYMYSVSSALVALGFVSQIADGSDTVFGAFALTMLPTIYLLGCATYVRLVECSAEDFRYGLAINRIRGYYKELAGSQGDLFLLSGNDDGAGVFANMGLSVERRSPAFAFSTAISVVNAVVGGAVVGMVLGGVVDVHIWVPASVGVLAAATSVFGWGRHGARILEAAARDVTPRYPSLPPHRDR